jgi:hypothetical protein
MAVFSALRRFPLVLAAGLVGAVAVIVSNHSSSPELDKSCDEIFFAVLFAFPVLVAAVYAGELFPRRKWIFQIVSGLAILAHWHFLDPDKEGLSLLLVWIAAVCAASVVPGLVSKPDKNWWRVNIGALNAIILASILTLIVLVGSLLAVESIQALFDLEILRLDGDVIAICGLLVAPLAVTALLPAAREEVDANQSGFVVWGRLCQWALVPMGFLFTGILAAYAVRILLERQLPDGMVAMPVLALGCYGLAAQLILEPWRADKVWARAFSMVFPLVFPLFSILLFVALASRISEYGFTWQRYTALALAILIVACCVGFLFRRWVSPAFAPALLGLLALVAAFGPLSSQQVCLRSQSAILESLLANRSAESDARIASSLRYLAFNYDRAVLERFTGTLELKDDGNKYDLARAAREKLDLPEVNSDGSVRVEFEWPSDRAVSVEGYRTIHGLDGGIVELGKTASNERLAIRVEKNDLAAFAGPEKVHAFDFSNIDPDAAEGAAAPPEFLWSFEGREFRVVVIKAEWDQAAAGERELKSAAFVVLEK